MAGSSPCERAAGCAGLRKRSSPSGAAPGRPNSGFLSYQDATGHGLSNQGWKDSGDAMQFRDGRQADGPIALSDVQGYAYQAAVDTADLFDAYGEPGGQGRQGQHGSVELHDPPRTSSVKQHLVQL